MRKPLLLAVALVLVGGIAAATRDPARAASVAARPAAPPPAIPPLTHLERLALARRHAPELRFNAWFPMTDPSRQHRSEDYLPASVDRFFADLARAGTTVVVRPSRDERPALARRVEMPRPAVAGPRAIDGYPPRMAGDAPGAAPIYADVYPDGADPAVYFAEYWVFYPHDEGDARFAGGVLDGMGGHRSDWEHISLRLRAGRGAETSEIEGAVYYGHDNGFFVAPEELELLGGAHPVVYVSQGKHASYPEAGEWRDFIDLAPVVEFDDVFHGNGVRIRTFEGEIVDIAHAAPRATRPAWLERLGRWGPDDHRIFGKPYALSSVGPWFHRESNDRFAGVTGRWADVKLRATGLRCDRDRGIEAPRVEPPPVPIVID